MLLSFDTKNQIITRTDANRAIANSTDYFEVSVTFSANWNGYDKTICFKNGDTEINIMLVNNAVPKEAHLNLGVGTWKVSIIGIKGNHKILTNAVNLPVGASGYIGTTGPTPRVYEELLTIIQSLHTEVASEAALRSAVEQFVDENFHDIVISDVYSKSEIDSMIVTKTVNDLVYYWNKSQTYNRAEIEALIEAAIQGTYIVVQTLPTTDISTHAIYLVPKESATVGDYYDEYINTTGTSAGWEHIGTTEIDLSNYYTKAEVNALLDNKVDKVSGKGLSTNDYDNTAKSIVDGVTSALANKVDKETGKGLSTNDYDNTAKGIVDGVTAALAGKVDKVANKGLSTEDYTSPEKTKLAGISDGATKTESSLTNGHLKIDGVEKTVYDDTALDSRVDVVEQDLSTDTATVEGNPLNFTTLSAQKAVETVISLEPIQDLHGYDHPWPAGGGKNHIPESWEQGGVGSNTITVATYNEKKGGSSNRIRLESLVILDSSKTYTLSCALGYKYVARPYDSNGQTVYPEYSPFSNVWHTEPITFTGTDAVAIMVAKSDDAEIVPSEFVSAKIQLELGSTATSFAPYSNYCPIDGRTETSLVGCGKNAFDISTARSGYVDENGEYVSYSGFACSGYIRVNGDTSYIAQYNRLSTTPGRGIRIAWFDKNMTFIQRDGGIENTDVGIKSYTTISPANAKFAMVSMPSSGYAIEALFMIGSQPTTYEPYIHSNNLTIQFGEKVYGATVELEKGTVTVDRGYKLGSELSINNKESLSSGHYRFVTTIGGIKRPANLVTKCEVISSVMKAITVAQSYNASAFGIAVASDSNTTFISDTTYDDMTIAQFKTAIADVQFCYKLATPRTITLTPNEISLLSGVNIISSDADGIKLTYRDGKVATLGDLDGLVKKIADCEDVEITNLQASDVLVWDATAGKWKNQQSTSMVVYDDTEQVIGTWFGETLYKKSFRFTPSSLDEVIDISTLGIKDIISGVGYWTRHSGNVYTQYPLGDCETPSFSQYDINVRYEVTNGNLRFIISGYGTVDVNQIRYTIQYTKTTPTLLMQSTPTEESTPADESESTDENR